jgi:hypothetical protein
MHLFSFSLDSHGGRTRDHRDAKSLCVRARLTKARAETLEPFERDGGSPYLLAPDRRCLGDEVVSGRIERSRVP